MRRFCSILALGIWAASALAGGSLSADDSPSDPNRPTVVKVTLHPQEVPRAALKYELLPPYIETTRGNAATLWYRAILSVNGQGQTPELQQVYDQLNAVRFSAEAARPILDRYQIAFAAMRDAARRDHCDWDLPLRTENPNFVILAEMQDSRTLAVLLALQARIQIHEGKYDEAIRTLQTGFALARDVNECPLIICNLISVAINQILIARIEEMLQRPDAPNLYWALTALPEPLSPIDRAVDYEKSIPWQMFPFLRNAADADHSDAEWQRLWDEAAVRLSSSIEGRPANPWEMRIMMAANSVRLYPRAKELLKSRGFSSDRIERMPVGQVLAIYSAEILDEALGKSFKSANVPLWQQSQDDGIGELLRTRPEVLPIARNLLPAVRQFQSASQRLNRRIAELRTLEALRAAAATRDGQLPDSLVLPETPVPRNPCTGADFGYMRDGRHAVLKADESPFSRPNLAREYEITLETVK